MTPPPGPPKPLPPNQWIAFALNPTSPGPGQTVTLSVANGSTATPADLWGANGAWPTTWSSGPGGFTLAQLDPNPCRLTDPAHPGQATTSCAFKVSGNPGTYNNVLFGVNVPPEQVQNLQQNITVPNPPNTTPPTQPPAPSAVFSGPPTHQLTPADQFTFKAPGEPGVAYTWTLSLNDRPIDQQSGPSYTPPATIFQTAGVYTLTLHAENQNTHRFNESSGKFQVAPPPSNASPPPQQGPPVAPPAAGPPAAAQPVTQVSFTPRLADFATPKPGAVQPVTVIWLWRPDWFQSAADQVRTAGRPSAVRRAAVSVNATRGGPSATPWLAGLATFGIFGAAWLAVRRRRVRTSILD